MSIPARACLVLFASSLLISGCGGEPAAVVDKDAVLRLKLDEYRIQPQVIRVNATTVPVRIKIVARNLGRLTHNVKIERPAQTSPDTSIAVDAGAPLGGTPTAQPGQTVRSGDIYLQPGTYRLTDSIGNHDNLGQFGTLYIEPAPLGG